MSSNELMHHGIKGMRWGVRRTPAQLGHKTSGKKKKTASAEKPKELTTAEKKAQVLKSKSARSLYDNKDLFDDNELRDAYKRLVLENEVKKLAGENKGRAEQFIDKTIHWGKKVSDLASTGVNLYNNLKNAQKVMDDILGDDEPQPASSKTSGKKKNTDKSKSKDKSDNDKSDDPPGKDKNKNKSDDSSSNKDKTNGKDADTFEAGPGSEGKGWYVPKRVSFWDAGLKDAVYIDGNTRPNETKYAKSERETDDRYGKKNQDPSQYVYDPPNRNSGSKSSSSSKASKVLKTIWDVPYEDITSPSASSTNFITDNYYNSTVAGLLGSGSVSGLLEDKN